MLVGYLLLQLQSINALCTLEFKPSSSAPFPATACSSPFPAIATAMSALFYHRYYASTITIQSCSIFIPSFFSLLPRHMERLNHHHPYLLATIPSISLMSSLSHPRNCSGSGSKVKVVGVFLGCCDGGMRQTTAVCGGGRMNIQVGWKMGTHGQGGLTEKVGAVAVAGKESTCLLGTYEIRISRPILRNICPQLQATNGVEALVLVFAKCFLEVVDMEM
ncbi:hypothetical protein RIF29_42323 [Crotalaria pallida]|uniref:Uncharacterized protein n=1 Tax=Crotalaria pallida TaxID=3830 RepID=A0AAN9HQ71_CROPI